MAKDIKAVVFDMDGTLYDLDFTVQVMSEFGKEMYLGEGKKFKAKEALFSQYIELAARSLKGTDQKEMEDYVSSNFKKYLFPGVESSLRELKESGKILCLTTSNFYPFARAIALGLGFDYFYSINLELDEKGKLTGRMLDNIRDYDESRREQIASFSHHSGIICENIAYVGDDAATVGWQIGLPIVYRLYYPDAMKFLEGKFYVEMKDFSDLPSIIKRFENTN